LSPRAVSFRLTRNRQTWGDSMRIVWLGWCFLAAACASLAPDAAIPDLDIPDFNNTIAGGDPGQTIAFVGEKIAVQQSDYSCPENHICMDARFHARYRIVELLEGQFDGDVIDFIAYDHYGYPNFARADRPLIYVVQVDDELYHHKYAFDVLNTVRGGGYATCGDPYNEYEPEQVKDLGREDLTPYAFDPPVTFRISNSLFRKEDTEGMSQDDIREGFLETMRVFAPPAFEINGDVATCRMGMSAKDVAAVRMRYEYVPQRLHAERNARCWKAAGLPSNGATVQQMETSGYNACMKEGD
jgi:hypothetical protein